MIGILCVERNQLPLALKDGGNSDGRIVIAPHIKNKQLGKQQQCWRQCGQMNANHSHIFWSCIKIQTFWERVIQILEEILCYKISRDPQIVYIELIPSYIIQKETYISSKSSYLHVKSPRRWWKCDPPRTGQWLDIVEEIYFMEKLTHYLRTKAGIHEQLWGKWTAYKGKDGCCSPLT